MKDRIESIILQYSMTDAEASHLSDELFKLFAQQNTLTLESKVDEYHELKKKIQNCIDVRQISGDPNNDLIELRNMIELFTIKRLDNEKALRGLIKNSIDKLDQEQKHGQLDEFEKGQYYTFKMIQNLLNQ